MFRATPENINSVYNKMPTQTGQSVYNSNANQPLIYEQETRKDDNIDNQIIVQKYRDLRRQQKQFLLKINLSTKLKRQIFGFTDTRDIKRPDQNQKLVTLIDPFKGRLIMKQRAWLEIQKEKENQRIAQQKQFYYAFEKQEEFKRQERQQKQEQEQKAKQQWDKIQEQRILNQNKTNDKKINIADIFSFLPGLGKKKEDQNKQANKNIKQKQYQQIIVKQNPRGDNSKQKVIIKQKANIFEEQRNQIEPNAYKVANRLDSRYSKKNDRNISQLPYTPSKDNLNSNYSKQNISMKNIRQKTVDNKLKNQNLRSQTRQKQSFNENYEVTSQISEIPKKQVYQQFSNPSFDADQKLEDEGSEQVLKQKSRRITKTVTQKKLKQ